MEGELCVEFMMLSIKKVDTYAGTYATHLFRDLHTRVLKKKKGPLCSKMNYNTLLEADLFSKLLVPFTKWFANDCSKGVSQVTFPSHQHPREANNHGEPNQPIISNDFFLIFKATSLKIMIITIATNTQSLCASSFSATNLQG